MSSSTLPQKPKVGFKTTYLRVLTSNPPDKADWWAAKELIDTGHASGKYLTSKAVADHGEVTALVGFSPTVSGRLFADDIADQIRKQSWRYRLTKAGISIGSFAGGWLVGLLSDGSKAYVLKLLGL